MASRVVRVRMRVRVRRGTTASPERGLVSARMVSVMSVIRASFRSLERFTGLKFLLRRRCRDRAVQHALQVFRAAAHACVQVRLSRLRALENGGERGVVRPQSSGVRLSPQRAQRRRTFRWYSK